MHLGIKRKDFAYKMGVPRLEIAVEERVLEVQINQDDHKSS